MAEKKKVECRLDCCFNCRGYCSLSEPKVKTKTNDFGVEYETCEDLVPFESEFE